MKAVYARSYKMPTLNSIYVTDYDEEIEDLFREKKPFTSINRKTKTYEITYDIYKKIAHKVDEFVDERVAYPVFERKSKEKYGYQEDAVEFARKTNNVLINFPQGTGKTLTAMKIITDKKSIRTLVICGQGNLQEEWLKDIAKHGFATPKARIIGNDTEASHKAKIKWLQDTLDDEYVLDLINIEALRDVDIVGMLNRKVYDCIVLDEVQAAKGWQSEQTKGVHELTPYEGQVRIAMSGTPILNDLFEYFSVLRFLGMLKETARTTFEAYYGTWAFDFWGRRNCTGYRNIAELKELIAPIICRISKAELALPPKTRRKIDLPLGHHERYDYLLSLYSKPIKTIKRNGFNSKPGIRAEMLFISSTAPQKIEFIKNIQEKQLVFSQYTKVLDKYEEELKQAGKRVGYYHGKLKMKERLDVIKRFKAGEFDILLLSLMTARYGLNLTEASITNFLEPPTSYGILEQGEDRVHRIGQYLPCTSNLLCSTPLDEAALSNIVRKQEEIEKLEF